MKLLSKSGFAAKMLIVLLKINMATAQITFPTDSAKWCLEEGGGDYMGDPCFYSIGWRLSVSHDSIINDKVYHLCDLTRTYYFTQSIIDYHFCSADNSDVYYGITGGYREDSGKIYFNEFENGLQYLLGGIPDTTDILLYDFNMNIGDTIQISLMWGTIYEIVTYVDTIILADGIPRKRFQIMHGFDPGYESRTIIEGIGDENYGLLGPVIETPFESYLMQNCYWENGSYLLGNDSCDYFEAFLPVTGQSIEMLTVNPTIFENEIIVNGLPRSETIVIISDITGKIFYEQSCFEPQLIISTSQLPAGLYLVSFFNANYKYATQKVMKY